MPQTVFVREPRRRVGPAFDASAAFRSLPAMLPENAGLSRRAKTLINSQVNLFIDSELQAQAERTSRPLPRKIFYFRRLAGKQDDSLRMMGSLSSRLLAALKSDYLEMLKRKNLARETPKAYAAFSAVAAAAYSKALEWRLSRLESQWGPGIRGLFSNEEHAASVLRGTVASLVIVPYHFSEEPVSAFAKTGTPPTERQGGVHPILDDVQTAIRNILTRQDTQHARALKLAFSTHFRRGSARKARQQSF